MADAKPFLPTEGMRTIRAVVGKLDVVATGSIVVSPGEDIQLFPFQDDPTYCLKLVLVATKEIENSRYKLETEGEKTFIIRTEWKWSVLNEFIIEKVTFAEDIEKSLRYIISYHISIIHQSEELFTHVCNFTIFSEDM